MVGKQLLIKRRAVVLSFPCSKLNQIAKPESEKMRRALMVEGGGDNFLMSIPHQVLVMLSSLITFPLEFLKHLLDAEHLVINSGKAFLHLLTQLLLLPWEFLKHLEHLVINSGKAFLHLLAQLLLLPWEFLKHLLLDAQHLVIDSGKAFLHLISNKLTQLQETLYLPWESLKHLLLDAQHLVINSGKAFLHLISNKLTQLLVLFQESLSLSWEKLNPILGKAKQIVLETLEELLDPRTTLGKAFIICLFLLALCLFLYCCSCALVVLGNILQLCGGALKMVCCTAPKMMKAPGQVGVFIVRSAFEANTKAYFLALRVANKAIA